MLHFMYMSENSMSWILLENFWELNMAQLFGLNSLRFRWCNVYPPQARTNILELLTQFTTRRTKNEEASSIAATGPWALPHRPEAHGVHRAGPTHTGRSPLVGPRSAARPFQVVHLIWFDFCCTLLWLMILTKMLLHGMAQSFESIANSQFLPLLSLL